jgi:hypothetical protein
MTTRTRTILAALALAATLAALTLAAPATASGDGAETTTIVSHDVTVPEVIMCTGEPVSATLSTLVFHTALLPNGEDHGTIHGTGEFTLVRGTETYTAHVAVAFLWNHNRQNETFQWPLNARATSASGEVLRFHFVVHFSTSASDPPQVQFFVKQDCD